jgi:hypothetical protein
VTDIASPESVWLPTAGKGASSRRVERESARAELAEMSQAMISEHGLLNHVQAALLLGVSVKRVSELVRLAKFSRFDFLGRTYVSVREVRDRYQQELKAGRPKQTLLQKTAASLKAALETDSTQCKLGGFAGPYEKAKRKPLRHRLAQTGAKQRMVRDAGFEPATSCV